MFAADIPNEKQGDGVEAHERARWIDLDEADERIIDCLKQDARMPFSEMARRLGVSPGMVRQRYQRLVKEGVLHVTAITNRLVLGHAAMAMIGIKADLARLEQIAGEIGRFDEVIYIVVLAGSFDLLAEVSCRSNQDLLDFLQLKLGRVDGVRDFETFTHLKIVKEVYN
ncbi:MAG: Lrp/AsnC family transcriptional regulator [Thermoleophilia bacterium]